MTGSDPPGVEVRPLRTREEREACVRLQEEIWGPGLEERVPASLLMVAQEMGGVASGAFEGGRLLGFVFGITGLREGRLGHWSDMLAVRASERGRGIGLALKRHQRDVLRDRGVEVAWWTFDPLVARNAHINLNRLGATAREYRRDVYGASPSPLHAGLGTDRLVAEWSLRDGGAARPGGVPPVPPNAILNPPGRRGHGEAAPSGAVGSAPVAGIVVPSDILAVRERDPELARAWRGSVRAAFEAAFAAGYVAVALSRGAGPTATYVLTSDLAV